MTGTALTTTGPESRASAPNELRALSALAFDELRAFPGGIRDMHLGIAERAFRAVGPAARPVQVIHDALSRRAYDAIGSGAALLGQAADARMERRGIGDGVLLSATRSGSALIAALNGLIGDQLERSGSDLHQPTSVRIDGEAVALDQASLRAAFTDASPRLVVFLHGLMETEFSWRWGADDPGDTYGTRLARDLGCTPLYLRYNSGLHVSENGRAISTLLEDLVQEWPVEVREIALVGHSMGGLVARSACYQASAGDQRWTQHVRHVVSLTWGRRSSRACTWPRRRFTCCPRLGCSAPSYAGAPPGFATCAMARWSTRIGATKTPTRCVRRHARRCRS